MSLFKVCNWWSVQCPDILENYDTASLLCCRFGLNSNEKDYIVVGSHTGHLSIFYPTSELTEEGHFRGFKPTNLLLERKLKAPVLDLSAGRFSGTQRSESSNQLAVLHPFCLSIYNLAKVDGVAEHGSHTSLLAIAEHKFQRSAFAVCKGHFGRVKGREFLCVVHVDGTLTFYEQDGITFECTLPGSKALPSAVTYIPRMDSFVRVNSCWELESFSYQDLSQSGVNKQGVVPTWSLCIGEYAIDICTAQITSSRTAIMILGEHNLLCISDDGKVIFVIKLDYSPKCFCTFVIGWYWEPNARLITAVVSESSSLLLYDGYRLIWAAQLEDIPVAIQRSNLEDLPGGIVTLGAKGLLHVGFLGSEPYVFKVPPLNLQEMNFEKTQKELLELEKEIKRGIDLSDVEMDNISAQKDLELDFAVSSTAQKSIVNDKDVTMYSGSFRFKTEINVEQLQVVFNVPDGIKCSQQKAVYNNLAERTVEMLEVWFYRENDLHIPTAEVEVVVSFINKQSIPRVLTKRCLLPLAMFYEVVQPQKDGAIKITMTMNSDQKSKIHKLSSIYPEFCEDNDMQAIGLSSLCSEEAVTVVAAKNTNRFRIQSDCLEAIPLVLEAMIHFARGLKQSEFNSKQEKRRKEQRKSNFLVAAPNIPIEEIMLRIENHYKIQEDIKSQTALMDALWNQFKLFQRSLRIKKEDEPVDGLMMLIEKNYDDLVNEGDKLVVLRNNEASKRTDLSCAISLLKQIVGCLNIEYRSIESFLSALAYPVEDWTEASWEEVVAPAFDILNHYGPLCRSKAAIPQDPHPPVAAPQFEYDRFKRHVTSLIDRVCRLASESGQRQQILAPSRASKNSDPEMGMDPTSESEQNEAKSKDHSRRASQDEDDGDSLEVHRDGPSSDWLNSEVPPAGIPGLGQGIQI